MLRGTRCLRVPLCRGKIRSARRTRSRAGKPQGRCHCDYDLWKRPCSPTEVTKTIPIVLTTGDLVGTGLAASLARPGGNVTGLSVLLPELSGKRLELLKETLPKITRIAVLGPAPRPAVWNPGDAGVQPAVDVFKEVEVAAQAHTLQLYPLE